MFVTIQKDLVCKLGFVTNCFYWWEIFYKFQNLNVGGKYGNTVQPKSVSHFKKKVISTKEKGYSNVVQPLFILTFKKSLSHFWKKLISTKEKAFLHNQKRFSHEKKVIKQKEKKCFSTHRFYFKDNSEKTNFISPKKHLPKPQIL